MTSTSIIFGSSFADDQEYRQICLNINRIKIAMELGHTVILCNLNNLYESLYDALNQVPEIPYILQSWSFSKLLYCAVIKVFVIYCGTQYMKPVPTPPTHTPTPN